MFIVLVLVLLDLRESIAIKCVPMNKPKNRFRLTLIDLNLDELHYYPFFISINWFDRTCNNDENPLGRICGPHKRTSKSVSILYDQKDK